MATCKFGWIGGGDLGMTCTMVCLLKLACGHSAKKESAGGGSAHYCDKCRQRRTIIESQ